MKLDNVYAQCNALAPINLSKEYCEKYGAYDNSGVLVDCGEDIKGVVFSLDFSLGAIEKAKQAGANLLITHHPAIYGKISDIVVSQFSPLGEKLISCIKSGISVISMHLNLDCACGGIDESLACAIADEDESLPMQIMHQLSQGGYGRAYDVKEISLSSLMESMKKKFQTERVLCYANGKRNIRRIASFCGSGADEQAVEFAVEQGADVIISSDFKHHVLTLAKEKGIAVISLTHYASENYGFYKFYQKICQSIQVPCVYYTDEEML